MKTLGYSLFLAGVFALHTGNCAHAGTSVSVNISSQPLWGPVGYDMVEYYYLPEMEMYYYVPARKYVYFNGGRWVFASRPPFWYRNYDMFSTYKVVINRPRPYRYFHTHRVQYAPYRHYHNRQVVIRSSRNPKYYAVKGHPHHHRYKPGIAAAPDGNNWKHNKKHSIHSREQGTKHYPNRALNKRGHESYQHHHKQQGSREFNSRQQPKQAHHGGRGGKHKGGR